MDAVKSRNRYHFNLTIYFGNLSTINNHLLYSYDAQVQVRCRTRMRRCDDAHDVRLPNWVVDSVMYLNPRQLRRPLAFLWELLGCSMRR